MEVSADTLAKFGGWIVAVMTALAAIWGQKRKADVDESALVLGKWKELVERHEADIKAVREEFAGYKRDAMAELTAVRERLAGAERRIAEQDEQIAGLKRENEQLKRTIAQNARSTATLLGDATPVPEEMADMLARLDRAGHNKGSAEE